MKKTKHKKEKDKVIIQGIVTFLICSFISLILIIKFNFFINQLGILLYSIMALSLALSSIGILVIIALLILN